MPLHRHRRSLPVLLAAVCSVPALAGCGSSSTATKRASNLTEAVKFAECMRSHGVLNYPDPQSFAGGAGIRLRIDPTLPVFGAAESACRHFFPVVGEPIPKPAPAAMAQMLAISKCMRAHGIYGFPDPTATPPSRSTGVNLETDGNGVTLAIASSIDMSSPLFTPAAAACAFQLPPGLSH